MVDKVAARRGVDMYRQDTNSFKATDETLSASKEGIDRDPRLRNIRVDADGEDDEKSSSQKLDMILSHLDSLHNSIADTNARMDAMEGKGREDREGGDDQVYNDQPGAPRPLVADSNELTANRDARDASRGRKDAEYTSREPINQDLPIERHDAARRDAASFQARADRVFQAYQDHAPRFMDGETLSAYKQRLLSKLKKYSQTWKKTDIYRLRDPEALAIAADQIFADADAFARSPASVPEGHVRAVTEKDRSGREIVRFYGNPESVWGMFKSQSRRLVGVNNNPDRR